jgi:hypothetical protein
MRKIQASYNIVCDEKMENTVIQKNQAFSFHNSTDIIVSARVGSAVLFY